MTARKTGTEHKEVRLLMARGGPRARVCVTPCESTDDRGTEGEINKRTSFYSDSSSRDSESPREDRPR